MSCNCKANSWLFIAATTNVGDHNMCHGEEIRTESDLAAFADVLVHIYWQIKQKLSKDLEK